MSIRVGILAIQGSVEEHAQLLKTIEDVEIVYVKKPEELYDIDGLIFPGGESTAIGKLMENYNLIEPIKEKSSKGMPIWGTCAGMILLANKISNQEKTYLRLIDIKVKRNAYGSQLDSFVQNAMITEVSDTEIPLVFIRAPFIEEIGAGVRILLELDDKIVAAESENILVTSFHPELTNNNSFHRYFIKKIKKYKASLI